MGYVFLSYARPDQPYVKKLAAEASRRGIETWFDSEIQSGQRWLEVIEDQVRGCAVFTPVVTPAARKSVWCLRELLLADHLNKPVLGLVQVGTDVPMPLVDRQYETVDGRRLPGDRWFSTLDSALGRSMGRRSGGEDDGDRYDIELSLSPPHSRPVTPAVYLEDVDLARGPRPMGARREREKWLDLVKKRLANASPITPSLQQRFEQHLGILANDPVFAWDALQLLAVLRKRPDHVPPAD